MEISSYQILHISVLAREMVLSGSFMGRRWDSRMFHPLRINYRLHLWCATI